MKQQNKSFLPKFSTNDDKKNETAKIVAEVLGFVSRQAKEHLVNDIIKMINHSLSKELDGYVLALSRITEKDLMKECITEAFKKTNSPIPDKYESKFL